MSRMGPEIAANEPREQSSLASEATARETLRDAPLGHSTEYPDRYSPALLFAVPRAPQRALLGIVDALPFRGVDIWTAYDMTWLDDGGKPHVALATIEVPVASTHLVESKSMKLYLGSFAQSRFADMSSVSAAIERDVSKVVGMRVNVTLRGPQTFDGEAIRELAGENLDDLAVSCDIYEVDPTLVSAAGDTVTETLTTRLFRSVCPVTGQPDIASVQIRYQGPQIDHEGLLRYLVSYRCHAGFHEHCVERIFVDVRERCRCTELSVLARFTRRGGLDINPFRTNADAATPANVRTARQ